jgi:hypothetical protein
MTSPNGITWGSHQPASSASPHIRLRCAIFDLLISGTVETATHSPGSYFETTAAVFRPGGLPINTGNPDFHMTVNASNGLPTLLSAYGFDPSHNIGRILFQIYTWKILHPAQNMRQYTVFADANVYDNSGNPVIAATEDGVICPLGTCSMMQWQVSDGTPDLASSIDWRCIIAIAAHNIVLAIKADGAEYSTAENRARVMNQPDPLIHLGYRGWPGFILRDDRTGVLHPSFRRA